MLDTFKCAGAKTAILLCDVFSAANTYALTHQQKKILQRALMQRCLISYAQIYSNSVDADLAKAAEVFYKANLEKLFDLSPVHGEKFVEKLQHTNPNILFEFRINRNDALEIYEDMTQESYDIMKQRQATTDQIQTLCVQPS